MSTLQAESIPYDTAPPAYTEKAPPYLAICPEYLSDQPLTIRMKSKHDSPDWAIVANGQPLFFVETESIKLREKHEMQITDVRDGSRAFTIKRRTVDNIWRYSASSPGKDGVKLLEFDSPSDLLSGSSSRLIFRNKQIDELEALILNIPSKTDKLRAEVLYDNEVIGTIRLEQERSPEFEVKINRPGIDPLLLISLVLCMDDRMMSQRRRTSRGIKESSKRILRSNATFMAAWYAFLL